MLTYKKVEKSFNKVFISIIQSSQEQIFTIFGNKDYNYLAAQVENNEETLLSCESQDNYLN